MRHQCEVCQSFRPQGHPRRGASASEVSFGSRRVYLCTGHALIAENSGVKSLAELRALYRESDGSRSFVSRRGNAAAKPASERRRHGRRAGDSP